MSVHVVQYIDINHCEMNEIVAIVQTTYYLDIDVSYFISHFLG